MWNDEMQSLNILSDFNKLSLKAVKNFDEIDHLYDKISEELEQYALMDCATLTNHENNFVRLEIARERLISFVIECDIDGLPDVQNLLNFWYKTAILEKSDQDILITDNLVIAAHKYISTTTV